MPKNILYKDMFIYGENYKILMHVIKENPYN